MILQQIFSQPLGGLFFIISIIIAVTLHEFAHAKTADVLGDPTPESLGRVTLNPLAHLDLFGSVLFLLIGFGWGKPVPFDPFNLDNPKRDAALIAFAGPITNIILALLASAILFSFTLVDRSLPLVIGQAFLQIFIQIQIVLALFNLIPVAPLDGFKVVGGLLDEEKAAQWYSLERYGIIFLLFILLPFANGQSMLDRYLIPAVQFVTQLLIP